MPYPPPSRVPPGPRRRSLLASVAGGALLVGCSDGSGSVEEGTAGSPSVVERVRVGAARDSRGIVERYDAVLAAHPALAERVGPLRAEAVRHAEAFGESVTAGSAASPSGSASPAPSPSPSVVVPATETDALAQLAAAERELADRRARTLLEVPGELARLLASVAAAGAAHAYLLTERAR
ncbi:hypothetical protein [Streptomyces sp. SAI-041]|uniref:hypothetical protein n=1 Tax=Streptomyces sp. SAI-041 TaxID=2940548 RepID=UPI002473FC30|nr:hypothetical protein [Streptomyces sp. SAI-041]MDH6548338.1 hypothetical protein [Streptomyces sp. SAI-041]